ncbi:MAG TPA: hypothetical protein VLY85_01190 [Thermoplasmata archaeon]|nr:hypothetical protein [Thermoplasmata archaeon]
MRDRRASKRRCEQVVGLLVVVLAAASALPGPTRSAPIGSDPGPVPTGRAIPSDGLAPIHPTFASAPLRVVIEFPNTAIEPNTTYNVSALAGGGSGDYTFAWTDTLGDRGTGPEFPFVAPPRGEVGFGVRVADLFNETAVANATIGVEVDPAISISADVPATDVGLPIPITILAGGGSPPFTVSWQALPGGSSSSSTLSEPGEIDVAAAAPSPGYEWIRATVVDRFGISATVQAIVATVYPMPVLLLTAVRGEVDAGSTAYVSGLLSGGTPPFSWAAATSLPAENVTGAVGRVGFSEPINWSGSFRMDGSAVVRFAVLDGAGIPLSGNVTIEVFPALSPVLLVGTSTPAAGTPLNVSVDLGGGLAPYDCLVELSDGETFRATAASPGPLSWTAHPTAAGYLEIRFSVSDALSGEAASESTIIIAPAPSLPDDPSSPGGTSSPPPAAASPARAASSAAAWGQWALGGLGLAMMGALLLFLGWRRLGRRPRPEVPSDSKTVDAIRRLSGEPDGIEKAALVLLAQEEGIGASELDLVLGRLESEGRVRLEPVPDGGSTVHWVTRPEGPTSGTEGR